MIYIILFVGLFIRIVVAIWNGFFGPSFGADVDAIGMHNCAIGVAQELNYDEFQIGTVPYTNFLGTIYYYFTDSLFLGSIISCFAWFYSAIILQKCLKVCSINKKSQIFALLIYSFLPTSLMWTSVTMREPFQLLFLNISLYSSLKIFYQNHLRWWCCLVLSCIGMGLLHGALLAYSVFIVSTLIFLKSLNGNKQSYIKILFILPIIVLIFFLGLLLFESISYKLENGLIEAIVNYQLGGMSADARTQYKSNIEINGLLDLIFFFFVSLFQYLLEPLPWKISSEIDIVILIENFIRIILFWNIFCYLNFKANNQKKICIFILVAYLLVETIWSIGTISWGTAARHHLPSLGMLILIGFIGKTNNVILNHSNRRIS